MSSGCTPLGPVLVAEDFEATERDVTLVFLEDGVLSPTEKRVLDSLRTRRKRSQRVAHRVTIAMSWMRGDSGMPRGRVAALEADYVETYAAD